MVKKSSLFMKICFIFGHILINVFSISCFAKFPNKISDCTSLSTIAYNCCFVQGTSITSSFLTYKLCYGFKAGKEPSEYPPPNLSPQLNIDSIECGISKNVIKKKDLCGVENPQNASVCHSFSSNCCFLNYEGYKFCLNKNTFDSKSENLELTCGGTYLFKFSFLIILLNFLLL